MYHKKVRVNCQRNEYSSQTSYGWLTLLISASFRLKLNI